jgi:hypothetical protein
MLLLLSYHDQHPIQNDKIKLYINIHLSGFSDLKEGLLLKKLELVGLNLR